jgi:hypothetical protein
MDNSIRESYRVLGIKSNQRGARSDTRVFRFSGGAKGGLFYSKRYAAGSGLNSSNLDFLPVRNIEEMDVVLGGVAAIPVGK